MDRPGRKQIMNEYSDRLLNPASIGAAWTPDPVQRTFEQAQGGYLHPDQERLNQDHHLRLEERRKERAHIARELHDTLFQGFLGASLLLQTTVERLPADSPSRTPLSHALRVMCRVLDEGRAALEGLRSPRSASTSLEQALCALGGELAFGDARFRVFVTGKPKILRAETQEQIYRIGREAVINSLRHSKATSIEVQVEYLPEKVRVILRDNGSGIDPEVLQFGRNSHWGLLGMRERATEIGAQLSIRSRRGAGTEVEITVAADGAQSPRQD
jgi:signal transduction histidine kinase